MKRVAILLDKNLSSGEIGNVSAILMGILSKCYPEIFASDNLHDKDGVAHASIQHSTVVLKAGSGQLQNFAKAMAIDNELPSFVFTKTGQGLHNRFDEYKDTISSASTEELEIVGVIIMGEDASVRRVTKKYSLLK